MTRRNLRTVMLLQGSVVKDSENEGAQSCPILCGPMDCSLPRSSVHGISQARVLEWGAIAGPKVIEQSSGKRDYFKNGA